MQGGITSSGKPPTLTRLLGDSASEWHPILQSGPIQGVNDFQNGN